MIPIEFTIEFTFLLVRYCTPQSINEQRDFSDGGLVVRNKRPHCCGSGLFPGQGSLSSWGFPSGSDGKDSACNAGDPGSIPGSGRSPGEGNSNPLQYSCLENSMDRGGWQASCKELQRVGHAWATNMDSPVVKHLSFHYRGHRFHP